MPGDHTRFYYDIKEWDGAKDLYSMMGLTDQIKKYPRLKQYIPNYHINLADAGRIEDVEQFHTDLQEVMGMLRYRRDKEGLQNYVKEHAVYFSDLDMNSYYAISAFLKSERLMNKICVRHWKICMKTELKRGSRRENVISPGIWKKWA